MYDPEVGMGRYILTPPTPAYPVLHGPSRFGVRPGAPFLYRIPATGDRPMTFSISGLPEGLALDIESGLVTGRIEDRSGKEYELVIEARNDAGKAEKAFTIVVGEEICLTPPLGWNSWNCWRTLVNQEHVLASAKAMVDSGLADFGWTYINIDDAWQGKRGGPHKAIQPDPEKFPAFQEMCDEVHAMGLKVGIYSTPWLCTYAGRIGGSSDDPDGGWEHAYLAEARPPQRKAFHKFGKYSFAKADASQWAEWGIDFLKYDWRPNDAESILEMAEALRECGRDIVYSISNSAPVEQAGLLGEVANCWRTAGDLKDRWGEDGLHLNILEQWEQTRAWMQEGITGGPGHFPDPDMLVVGDLSTSCKAGELLPSNLTPDEQYAHISLWVLWASPLLIGCPIETMDAFTLNLLTNGEVLAVHQDGLALPGKTVYLEDGIEVIVRELADGSRAVGLFNQNSVCQTVSITPEMLGISGEISIRDLWRQKLAGNFRKSFSARIPPHGVQLLKAKTIVS